MEVERDEGEGAGKKAHRVSSVNLWCEPHSAHTIGQKATGVEGNSATMKPFVLWSVDEENEDEMLRDLLLSCLAHRNLGPKWSHNNLYFLHTSLLSSLPSFLSTLLNIWHDFPASQLTESIRINTQCVRSTDKEGNEIVHKRLKGYPGIECSSHTQICREACKNCPRRQLNLIPSS